jgi:hypothetical protein
MQQSLITEQVAAYVGQFKSCPQCGARRTRKGHHPIVYRTLFGKCNLLSPRLYDCACRNNGRHSSSPLAELPTSHCAPEFLYLQAKFASLMSYGLRVELLSDVLPIADEINPTSVRRHLHRVAERVDGELGDEQFQFIEGGAKDWAKQPPPGPPLTVGLDGGAKVFAFVNTYDTKPKRRLYEVLKSQGLQMNQQVVFLSDGGDTVRDLQAYLSPESEHLLDWFHVTMRLTVMGQMIKGMAAELKPEERHPETATALGCLEKHLASVKWNLWHGNVPHALQRIDDLDDDLDMLEENPANKKKMIMAVHELRTYIEANQAFIPNYGDRYRHEETISTAFVESTVNYVVSNRFVKKQQMRWTQRGAHLLLQTRVQVLNDDLRNTFCRWFPGMMPDGQAPLKAAA